QRSLDPVSEALGILKPSALGVQPPDQQQLDATRDDDALLPRGVSACCYRAEKLAQPGSVVVVAKVREARLASGGLVHLCFDGQRVDRGSALLRPRPRPNPAEESRCVSARGQTSAPQRGG